MPAARLQGKLVRRMKRRITRMYWTPERRGSERMDEDADEASVLQLRQQLLDEWPEGERRDTVLEAIDRLLSERRERERDGSLVRPDA